MQKKFINIWKAFHAERTHHEKNKQMFAHNMLRPLITRKTINEKVPNDCLTTDVVSEVRPSKLKKNINQSNIRDIQRNFKCDGLYYLSKNINKLVYNIFPFELSTIVKSLLLFTFFNKNCHSSIIYTYKH